LFTLSVDVEKLQLVAFDGVVDALDFLTPPVCLDNRPFVNGQDPSPAIAPPEPAEPAVDGFNFDWSVIELGQNEFRVSSFEFRIRCFEFRVMGFRV